MRNRTTVTTVYPHGDTSEGTYRGDIALLLELLDPGFDYW